MLRIDLFDLVDGLFRGVVYFFYNIFETIVHLVRRPFRGPIRLYRKRRQPDVRQLAGPTFLFLSFAAFFAVHHIMLARHEYDEAQGEAAIGDQLAAAVTSTPSLDADWLWLVLATSLAATVVVDASLRLALSSPGFGTRARRALVQEGVEYALFWPILLLLVLSLRPATLDPLQSAMLAREALDLDFIPFFLLALMPAALLLAAGLRSARRRAPGALPLLRLASLAAMAAIMFAASWAGARLGATIVGQRQEQRHRAAEQGPLVLDLDCALTGSDPHVDAIIWHRGADPLVLAATSLTLHIATTGEDNLLRSEEDRMASRAEQTAFDDPAGPSILLQPGEARRIRLLAPGYRYSPDDARKACGLIIAAPTQDAASAQAQLIVDSIDPPAE